MKIVWFSNRELSNHDNGSSGTWLLPMAQGLVGSGKIELLNITTGHVSKMTRRDNGSICQWIVPVSQKFYHKGLPANYKTVDDIVKVVNDFVPDLVHVWGVEVYWGLLTARKLINQTTLLEIQGLKFVWAKVFSGGLSFREQLSCVGLKEILKGSFIWNQEKQFRNWGQYEKEIISGHYYISTQSDWTQAQVLSINPNSMLFLTARALREDFCKDTEWQYTGEPIIFCTAAYTAPFKGLHVAIRALNILKRRFPNIQLRIAGAHQTQGIRKDGYISWICRGIRRMGLENNVRWLGALSGQQVADELLKCSAVVLPTYIESYCLALAEAMMLGVPTVVTYTGGTSFLAKDEDTALFFPPGDEAACAHQLDRLLTDKALALRLSNNAQQEANKRNSPDRVISRQLEIYQDVISDSLRQSDL